VPIRRRDFIKTIVASAIGLPYAARARQPSEPIIGFMSARSPEDSVNVLQAFHKGLREGGGFADGENVKVEYRWARGNYGLLPALASEFVERHVNVLVAVGGDASARAAKAATSAIPIVFTISGDPVEAGLVKSINRPGGNATGCIVFSTGELDAKRLDLMREIVPGASVFGVLINPKYPPAINQGHALEAAATKIGRAIFIVEASDDTELEAAFAALLQKRVGGFVVASDPFFDSRRTRLIAFAAKNRLPGIYQFRDYAVDGGLISYGPSLTETYRQVGIYAGRILKGAQPSDLPVMQPTKYDLVINLKTAEGLGVKVPQSLLVGADEVIE
jgi:putative tryptophan/tyrosine transport system substrate-binding protein